MYHGYRRPEIIINSPSHIDLLCIGKGDYNKVYFLYAKETHILASVNETDRRKHKKLNYNKYANIYDLVQDALTYLEKVAYEDCLKKGQFVMRKMNWTNLCSCGHTQLTSST
jgi:hypothetical protein